MNGLVGSAEYGQSSVVSPDHPPIYRLKKAAASDGIYPMGLVLSEKYDGDSNVVNVPYEEATGKALTGTVNGTNKVFTLTGTGPVQRSTVTIANNNATAQSLKDNGFGVLSGDGSGTINYETGDISATFTTAPETGKTVLGSFTRRVSGILTRDIDTSKDTLAIALVHGIAVRAKAVIDKTGTAVTDTVSGALEKLGVWLQ